MRGLTPYPSPEGGESNFSEGCAPLGLALRLPEWGQKSSALIALLSTRPQTPGASAESTILSSHQRGGI